MLQDKSEERRCVNLTDIPEDVLTRIFTFLTARQKLQVETVSKGFRRASADHWTDIHIDADNIPQHQAQLRWLGVFRQRNADLVSHLRMRTRGTCIAHSLPLSSELRQCSFATVLQHPDLASWALPACITGVYCGNQSLNTCESISHGSDLLYKLYLLQRMTLNPINLVRGASFDNF